jgi:hypothetical protein
VRLTAALYAGEGGGGGGHARGRRVHELGDENEGGVASQQAQAMSAGVAGVVGM